MDPVSHAALGRTLIAFDANHRLGAGASAACVLGALSPDLDLARAVQGWDVYLHAHQGGTHAVAGAIGCGLLTASVVKLAVRDGRWPALALAACAGALSHVTLDLIAGADIRPFWPIAERMIAWPLFAMADPWLVGLFVAALALLWRVRRPRVAAVVLIALVAMSGAKATLFGRASRVDARAAGAATVTRADAGFGSWRGWTFFHVIDGRVDRWHVDAVAGTARRALTIDRGIDAPGVAASRALPTVAHLIASHGITFARVRPRTDGGSDVLWSDLRYCGAAIEGSAPVCGLWFGGAYDARGRAIDAVVHLGSFVQRRPAATSSDDQ